MRWFKTPTNEHCSKPFLVSRAIIPGFREAYGSLTFFRFWLTEPYIRDYSLQFSQGEGNLKVLYVKIELNIFLPCFSVTVRLAQSLETVFAYGELKESLGPSFGQDCGSAMPLTMDWTQNSLNLPMKSNEGVTSQFFRHHRSSPSCMNSPYRALTVQKMLTPTLRLTSTLRTREKMHICIHL